MDSFDFLAIPSLNKTLVLALGRCEFLARGENVLLLGNSGTGKSIAHSISVAMLPSPVPKSEGPWAPSLWFG